MNMLLVGAHPPPHHRWAVLDTQAVLDWLYFDDPVTASWEAWRQAGHWQWVAGHALRAELAHVLGRGELPGASRATAQSVLDLFDERVLWQPDPVAAQCGTLRCTDPDDQKFIDFARVHQARWLVSRDRAVLKLRRRAQAAHGLLILPPRQWQPQGE